MADGRLEVQVGANIDRLRAGFQRAREEVGAFVDRTGTQLKELSDNIGFMGAGLTAGVTAPILALGKASLSAFADIDSLKKGLAAVAGGTEEAERQFVRLTKIAELPGLGLEEVSKGTINLQAIGFTAEQAEKSLQVFGNAVATVGKGRVEFERAIYGLQQLANTDFPLGEDLNILKDAIPQITPLLKDAFGTARSDDLAKLGITSKQVVDVITEGLGKLPPVAAGLGNAFENLADSTKISFAGIGGVLERNLNVSGLINKLSDALSGLSNWFVNLNPLFQDMIIGIAALAASIGPLLLAFQGIIYIAPLIGTAITAIGGPFTILAAAIGIAAIAIIKNWDQVQLFLIKSTSYIIGKLSDFVMYFSGLAEKVGLESLSKKFAGFADSLSEKSNSYATQAKALTGAIAAQAKTQETANGVTATATGLTKEQKEAAEGLRKTYESLSIAMKQLQADQTLTFGEVQTGKINAYKAAIQSLVSQGVDPYSKAVKSLQALQSGVAPATLDFNIESAGVKDTSLAIDGLKGSLEGLQPVATAWIGDWAMKTQELGATFSQVLTSGVADFASGFIEGIAGLATGTATLGQVGGQLLGIVGDIAVQLGKAAIGIGIGMIAIKAAFSNPLTAIAAGAALIAIGAVIKGAAGIVQGGGSGGGAMASPGGSGGSRSSSNYSNNSVGNGGSNGISGTVVFEIGGDKLIGVLKNTQAKNLRFS